MRTTSRPPDRQGLLVRWLKRRGPLYPPLVLRYRQIFILPTGFGWLLGLLMSAMMLGSLNFNNNLGLLTSFIVAGLAVLSLFKAYRNLAGLKIHRIDASPVFAGQPIPIYLDIENDAAWSRPGLEVRAGSAATVEGLSSGERSRIRIDQITHRRGWHDPGRFRVSTRHPLGLFDAWSWVFPARRLIVYPTPAHPAPPFPAHGGSQGQPDRRAEGEEFHSLRPWRAGDPLHRIAWKASQRHRALLSRQFQAEDSADITLSLNNAPGRDLEERIRVLTTWVVEAHRRRMAWSLELPDRSLGPGTDEHHLHRCLMALALIR